MCACWLCPTRSTAGYDDRGCSKAMQNPHACRLCPTGSKASRDEREDVCLLVVTDQINRLQMGEDVRVLRRVW